MSATSRTMSCTPDDVFAVLADGWLYAQWVVGAARMRDVDAHWPAAGARLHHSVGTWPLLISDTTSVESVREPEEIVLTARAWPTGEARVRLTLEPVSEGTRVTIVEDASKGPIRLMPKPIRNLSLLPRNRESLRRLAYLAEGRAGHSGAERRTTIVDEP